MVQASDIRAHMQVLGSDGAHVGTVDHMDGDRIKLAKKDSGNGHHHYLPLSSVARVDTHVHLTNTAAAALAAATTVEAAATSTGHGPLPPITNRSVENGRPRGNFYLPWIVGLIGLLLLLLLFRSCMHREAEPVATAPATTAPAATPLPVEAVTLPNGAKVDLAPDTMNYGLQRYLASAEPTPRTFTFDKLNFDTASAEIRAEDTANVDALAQILSAYPKAQVKVVGYTDARGTSAGNADLGQRRADAVAAALVAKGVDKGRIEATSGGESKPADTNATEQGQFENRRTELVVTAK